MRYGSITRAADFSRLTRQGRRSARGPLTLYVATGETGSVRLGMAIRADKAVTRNRVKRRLRAALRAAAVPEGTDVFVRADARARDTKFQELVDAFSSAAVAR